MNSQDFGFIQGFLLWCVGFILQLLLQLKHIFWVSNNETVQVLQFKEINLAVINKRAQLSPFMAVSVFWQIVGMLKIQTSQNSTTFCLIFVFMCWQYWPSVFWCFVYQPCDKKTLILSQKFYGFGFLQKKNDVTNSFFVCILTCPMGLSKCGTTCKNTQQYCTTKHVINQQTTSFYGLQADKPCVMLEELEKNL